MSGMEKRRRRAAFGEFEPIRRRKLSQGVLEKLQERMNAGEFPAGSLLPSERQLMEYFQVGRPAVREALQDLQRLGLVRITHGEGARVVAPTAQGILDRIAGTAEHFLATSPRSLDYLKEARLFFEMGMVRLVAARATPQDIETLRDIVAEQAAAGDDFADFLKTDMLFHRSIAAILGNPIFVALSEAMLQWLSKYHVGLVRKAGREKLTMAEHTLIVDRIAAHDVESAAAAMLTHLTRAQDLYASTTERIGRRVATDDPSRAAS
jgi:DNA-binding FadR family transcriptional regulator